MRIKILTLFPEYFDSFRNTSIIKRALDAKYVDFDCINFRDYTVDRHNNVDDTICGGGAGMLLMCQPIVDAIRAHQTPQSKVVLLSPQGQKWNQALAREYAQSKDLIFVCGHYEGFDERIREYVDAEVSIGDFVLTGGEAAAIAICDSIIRLREGVIRQDSHEDDSFENGLLEYPQYTRPIDFEGKKVPDVLLSGHHENIRKWRLYESIKKTYQRRPDLLDDTLSKEAKKMLEEIIKLEKQPKL